MIVSGEFTSVVAGEMPLFLKQYGYVHGLRICTCDSYKTSLEGKLVMDNQPPAQSRAELLSSTFWSTSSDLPSPPPKPHENMSLEDWSGHET